MSKTPPIPPEQRPLKGRLSSTTHADIDGHEPGRHERETGLEGHQPGDGGVNFKTEGRQANLRQNLTPRRVQSR